MRSVPSGIEKYDDKISKTTFVFCCRRELSESWGKYTLSNTRIIHEFTQCLLRNCDPRTMQVNFPLVLNDIRGENIEMLDLVHSMIKLPETRIKIKANQEEQKVGGKRSYFDVGNDSQDSFDYDEEEMVSIPVSELKKL